MSDPNPQTPPAEPKVEKTYKARVLARVTIGGEPYEPNDVAVVDKATLKAHADVLDAEPSAVKYAEALAKSVDGEEA